MFAMLPLAQYLARHSHRLFCRRLNGLAVAFGLALSLIAGPPGSAAAEPADLAAKIEAAKSQFRPITEDDLKAAKNNARAAADRLSRWLDTAGPEQASAWREYLGYEAFKPSLAPGADVDVAALTAAGDRLSDPTITGLEKRRFIALREALDDVVDTAFFSAVEGLQAQFESQLDGLAADVARYRDEPTDALAVQIGQRLDYLARTDAVDPLVEEVRMRISRPNLLVHISENLIDARIGRPVHRVGPIHMCILGTDIHGTATTTGLLRADVRSSFSRAVFDLKMDGVSHTNNVGRNGPATIYTTGVTDLHGVQPVEVTKDGLMLLGPYASARTRTSINRVTTHPRFLQRIASRQAAKKKGQAEVIASRRAEDRLLRQMAEGVTPEIAEANARFQEKFLVPLKRRGAEIRQVAFSATDDSLLIVALHAEQSQLGAESAAPPLPSAADFAVCVHESMVGNASETAVGGRKFTDVKMAELVERVRGEVPEELQIRQDKDPWSITFARRRPVSVAFRDGEIRIAITGTQFTRADQTLDRPAEISAVYTIERTDKGATLRRDGDVEVQFLGAPERLGVREIAFKTFLRNKFSALLKEEIEGDGLKPKGEMLEKVGVLRLAELSVENGWLAGSWNREQ